MSLINIFDYLDYREFLRDYYQAKKKDEPFFSYRYIGKRVSMDSSYLIKVLQGNLHISKKKIPVFMQAFDLNKGESEYFEALVLFGKSKTEAERKLHFEKLFSLSKVHAEKIDVYQYEFFSKWYYSAIWAIINCQSFDGDFESLAQQCRPAITEAQAKKAVKLLEKLKLIIKGKDGYFRTVAFNLTSGNKWQASAIESHQAEMNRLAGESLQRFAKQERDFSTVTLTVSEEIMPEVKNLITQFRQSLIKLVNQDKNSNQVCQLNVALFPLSRGLHVKK